MTNRVQSLRSSVTGVRPVAQLPGAMFTNFADRQLGVVDPTQAPIDLVAIRFFSTTANYVQGDYVVNGGQLYRAASVVAAGAFNPAQWTAVVAQGAAPGGVAAAAWAGTLAGAIALFPAAVVLSGGQALFVAGRNAVQDGYEGNFLYRAGDSATVFDQSGLGFVDAAGRRWFRVYSGAANVKWFGAIGDGIADDTVALTSAFSTPGALVGVPPGTYRTTANLQLACAEIIGLGDRTSVIFKPDAAVTKALGMGGLATYPTVLSRFAIDMVNTGAGAVGLYVGDGANVAVNVTGVQVMNGVGVGFRIANALKSRFECCTAYNCGDGMVVQGQNGALPTTITFANCVFVNSIRKGVQLLTGYELRFEECDFESSGEEGSYISPPAADVIEVTFANCWWEDNWRSLSGNASARALQFHHTATTTVRTVRHTMRDCYWHVGPGTCRATQCLGGGTVLLVLDNPRLATGLGLDFKFRNGASFNIPVCGLDVATAIDDDGQGGFGPGAPWYDIAPLLVFSTDLGNAAASFTGGTVSVGTAQIKKLSGKEWVLQYRWAATLLAIAPQYIAIRLPTVNNTKNNQIFQACVIANGATELGQLRPDGGNQLLQYRAVNTAYTAGASVTGCFNGIVQFQ